MTISTLTSFTWPYTVRLKSLKVKIAITLALLLFTAISLTNFVLLRVIEKKIMENHFEFASKWIVAMYEEDRMNDISWLATSSYENIFFPGIVFASYSMNGENMRRVSFVSDSAAIEVHADDIIRQVENTGRTETLFAGREWGVFWKRNKYLVIGLPLPEPLVVGTAIIELGSDYQLLRNSQQVAMGYLFLNFLILLLLGGYRLSGLVTRPIHKFVAITDSYRFTESLDLFPEKQNDEFNRLSYSLNRMMRRIENNRQELEQSIGVIEEANLSLKQAQLEIIKAEKLASIGRLSAGIAHEIGNPISIVLGYLGLIKSSVISPDDHRTMDYIQRAEMEINRINNIIRQLLDFSRPVPAGFTDLSIHELLYNTGRMLSQQPLMDNIRLFFDFSASNDVVSADYNQLHQVVLNLILNAADSISACSNIDQGEIRLVTEVSGDGKWLHVEVLDNGGGISREHANKVFDPFYTTKDTGKGTGLGLYVSYMIIDSLGGDISIGNKDTDGTRMIIRLPIIGTEDKP